MEAIAKKRGVSREAIYQTLRRLEDWDSIRGEVKTVVIDGKPLTKRERYKKIKEMVTEGETLTNALQKYKGAKQTFYKYHPEMKSYSRRLSSRETSRIVDDWIAGMTYKKLSEKYGKYTSDIQRRIKESFDDWEVAKELRKNSLSR